MNTTRFLFTSSAVLAVLLAGCADGKTPRIKSFQASNTALPEGGAPVTFTWDVDNAKSITLEPYPGAVTGTSATVVVTEATTFKLTAKNGDKKDSRRISFTVGEAFVVTGRAVDDRGRPAPAVQMFVDDDFYVTDENGMFTASGVVPPYDLGWVRSEATGLMIVAYRGVTRSDPVVRVQVAGPTLDGYATLSGTLSGGDGFPLPTPTPDPAYGLTFGILVPDGYANFNGNYSAGTYDAEIHWRKPPMDSPVTVGLLEYKRVPSLVYTGFGRQETTVTHLGSYVVDLALDPVPTGSIGVTADAPFHVDSSELWATLDLLQPSPVGGGPYPAPESYELPGVGLDSEGSVSLAVPVPPGASYTAHAYAYKDGEAAASTTRTGLAEGDTVTLALPSIPYLLSPVNGASAGPETAFNVAEVAGSPVYQYFFYSSGGFTFGIPQPAVDITVFSNANGISFPADLDLGGVSLSGRSFEWGVQAVLGFGDVDGVVRDGGNPPGNETSLSYPYASRFFTYDEANGAF